MLGKLSVSACLDNYILSFIIMNTIVVFARNVNVSIDFLRKKQR